MYQSYFIEGYIWVLIFMLYYVANFDDLYYRPVLLGMDLDMVVDEVEGLGSILDYKTADSGYLDYYRTAGADSEDLDSILDYVVGPSLIIILLVLILRTLTPSLMVLETLIPSLTIVRLLVLILRTLIPSFVEIFIFIKML